MSETAIATAIPLTWNAQIVDDELRITCDVGECEGIKAGRWIDERFALSQHNLSLTQEILEVPLNSDGYVQCVAGGDRTIKLIDRMNDKTKLTISRDWAGRMTLEVAKDGRIWTMGREAWEEDASRTVEITSPAFFKHLCNLIQARWNSKIAAITP